MRYHLAEVEKRVVAKVLWEHFVYADQRTFSHKLELRLTCRYIHF